MRLCFYPVRTSRAHCHRCKNAIQCFVCILTSSIPCIPCPESSSGLRCTNTDTHSPRTSSETERQKRTEGSPSIRSNTSTRSVFCLSSSRASAGQNPFRSTRGIWRIRDGTESSLRLRVRCRILCSASSLFLLSNCSGLQAFTFRRCRCLSCTKPFFMCSFIRRQSISDCLFSIFCPSRRSTAVTYFFRG